MMNKSQNITFRSWRIGLAAEPALIEFIAQHGDERSIEHANALKALVLISL